MLCGFVQTSNPLYQYYCGSISTIHNLNYYEFVRQVQENVRKEQEGEGGQEEKVSAKRGKETLDIKQEKRGGGGGVFAIVRIACLGTCSFSWIGSLCKRHFASFVFCPTFLERNVKVAKFQNAEVAKFYEKKAKKVKTNKYLLVLRVLC